MPLLWRLFICLLGGLSGGLLVIGAALAAPSQQTTASGITRPESGATISGVITVTGTAVDPDYLRYELAFRPEAGSDADWIVFAEGDMPVINGTLAIWDTTIGRAVNAPVWPDGRYRLRLRVVRTDYNYDEYFATNLTIINSATPTPTATLTATVTAVAPGTPVAPGENGSGFLALTPIPSLTPFPTPTPPLTPTGAAAIGGNSGGAAPEAGGVLGQLARLETSRLSTAFWQGVRLALALFGLLAAYLLVRAAARRLWRRLWWRRGPDQ